MKLTELKNIKIMFLDIETSPNIGYFWKSGYDIQIGHESIIKERQVIMVSWNWLDEPVNKTHNIHWGLTERSDKKLLMKFSKEFNKADIVIGHNGDNFDIKWLKTRTAIHGLDPLLNVASIDTLKLARSNFNYNSNKLDYLSQIMGEGAKLSTGYNLWKQVMAGNKTALTTMVKYCNNDVILLRKIFVKLLPYVKKLPVNMALFNNTKEETKTDKVCTSCAMKNTLTVHRGYMHTISNTYRRLECTNCHHTQRSTKPV